jgi:hypothetical protein
LGAPYPAFLALGGAVLAFVPGAPKFSIDPEVALALFVAPVLLEAAQVVRRMFDARLSRPAAVVAPTGDDSPAPYEELQLRAIRAARRITFEMRSRDDVGDDAFHRLEEEFDWIEMSLARR